MVADYRKNSTVLGEQWKQGVPIEVLPLAYRPGKYISILVYIQQVFRQFSLFGLDLDVVLKADLKLFFEDEYRTNITMYL